MVQVCDFGSACNADDNEITPYLVRYPPSHGQLWARTHGVAHDHLPGRARAQRTRAVPFRLGFTGRLHAQACALSNGCATRIQVSRFYRAPEIMMGLQFGCPIDMWAAGQL